MDLFSTDAARARTASDTTSEAAAMPRGKQREKSGGERARERKICSRRIFYYAIFYQGNVGRWIQLQVSRISILSAHSRQSSLLSNPLSIPLRCCWTISMVVDGLSLLKQLPSQVRALAQQ